MDIWPPSQGLFETIDWREIEDLPRDLASGLSFLFRRLSKHVFHVTLIVHNGEALRWTIEGAGANGKPLMDQDVALVTHFADLCDPFEFPPDSFDGDAISAEMVRRPDIDLNAEFFHPDPCDRRHGAGAM